MVTLEHEALVDLFRQHPALIATLLAEVYSTPMPRYARAAVAEASLGQLVPTEFRADLVIELRDEADVPQLAIVLEAQRGEDPVKRFSSPVYVSAARAKSGCPACVVVIATDPGVARWAARTIDLGLGRGLLTPIVFGPREVPLLDE